MSPETTAAIYALKYWLMSVFVLALIAYAWIEYRRDQRQAEARSRSKAARDGVMLESMVRMDEYRAKRRAR